MKKRESAGRRLSVRVGGRLYLDKATGATVFDPAARTPQDLEDAKALRRGAAELAAAVPRHWADGGVGPAVLEKCAPTAWPVLKRLGYHTQELAIADLTGIADQLDDAALPHPASVDAHELVASLCEAVGAQTVLQAVAAWMRSHGLGG